MTRHKIPSKVTEEVLIRSRRRCAMCFLSGDDRPKMGTIAHLLPGNEEKNDTLDNLVFLCEDHHKELDAIPPSARRPLETLKSARDDLYRAMSRKELQGGRMNSQKALERLDDLITKGEAVLQTHRPNPPNVIGFPTLDSGAFTAWKTQALTCLTSLLGEGHVYVENFREQVKRGFQGTVKAGIGILKATKEDIAAGNLEKAPEQSPLLLIEQICSRFHLVARQMRSRHGGRPTLDVQDEYDLQDLMHALLCLHFVDIRPEEYTPSYAGKASRMDFLLKQESIVIELKMTRPGLGPKELSTQLIEDIERYKTHPDCQALVCFVYDPAGHIPNPRGIESDLNRDTSPFPVRVLIRP